MTFILQKTIITYYNIIFINLRIITSLILFLSFVNITHLCFYYHYFAETSLYSGNRKLREQKYYITLTFSHFIFERKGSEVERTFTEVVLVLVYSPQAAQKKKKTVSFNSFCSFANLDCIQIKLYSRQTSPDLNRSLNIY